MIFKRKKKTVQGKTWYDISLAKFQELKGLDLKDLEGQIEAARILLGVQVDDMTWGEFCQELNKLNFLNEEIPKVIIRKTYTLNGRKYDTRANLQEFTVARYMDFVNQSKTGKWERILSTVLVPEGCEYGEYDMDRVYLDILSMSIVDAYAVFNFFRLQFIVCIKTMKDFSVKALKRNPELQELVSEVMESYSTLDL